MEKELKRLSAYAQLISDEVSRKSAYQGMQQEAVQLWSTFGADTTRVFIDVTFRCSTPSHQK